MILELKAKHFKDTEFVFGGNADGNNPSCGCAIEKAVFDALKSGRIKEGVTDVIIDGVTYVHVSYTDVTFYEDKQLATENNFDETVIRTIELIEAK